MPVLTYSSRSLSSSYDLLFKTLWEILKISTPNIPNLTKRTLAAHYGPGLQLWECWTWSYRALWRIRSSTEEFRVYQTKLRTYEDAAQVYSKRRKYDVEASIWTTRNLIFTGRTWKRSQNKEGCEKSSGQSQNFRRKWDNNSQDSREKQGTRESSTKPYERREPYTCGNIWCSDQKNERSTVSVSCLSVPSTSYSSNLLTTCIFREAL